MYLPGFNDDENELPGSTDWFTLDSEVGLGRTNRRADTLKVEGLLANSGDLDLSEIGGPTGYGLYTVEDGVKKYQARNGLEVDGWLKPGGPTITKMKEQLGGLLSGYPAPTPEQVDMHHRLRTQGKDGLLNIDPIPIALKPNPNLPKVDSRTHGSNESLVNWMKHHQKGLGGAPDMLATYIKNFGTDGIVQSRDFVEQWERALPGEGATAIRAVLTRLSDPAQQRAFLGGNLPTGTPFGVLKPDAAARIAEMNAPPAQEEPPEHDWVYDAATDTAWIRGSRPGDEPVIRDRLWRPGDEAKPTPLPYNPKDDEPHWEFDPITGNRKWVVPETKRPMSSDNANAQNADAASGGDAGAFNHGLLAPYLAAQSNQVGPGVQVAQSGNFMSDAERADAQVADASNAQQKAEPTMGPHSRNPQPKRIATPSAPPPIPPHRTEEFRSPDMQARWKVFNEAAEALPNTGKNERAVYAALYADEGGDKVNPSNGASAGVTNTTLGRLRAEGRLGDLPANLDSAKLGADDKAAVMRAAMDSAFQFYNKEPGQPPSANNNGHKIFETLTPEAGGVLGSTMYMHGGTSGARIVQNAINKVIEEKPGSGINPIDADGKFGGKARDAYHSLSTDPERRQALYDAIAEGRTQNLIHTRTKTDDVGNRIPGKVAGGETKLIERYRVNGAQ